MFTEYFYRKIITMIFYMFSCLRQYTQYQVKTKKKHSLLKKKMLMQFVFFPVKPMSTKWLVHTGY